jgi:hypothetical protein
VEGRLYITAHPAFSFASGSGLRSFSISAVMASKTRGTFSAVRAEVSRKVAPHSFARASPSAVVTCLTVGRYEGQS